MKIERDRSLDDDCDEDPVSLIHSIVNVAITLRAAVNQAKANRKQSTRLQARVDAIVAPLQTASPSDLVPPSAAAAGKLTNSSQLRTALNNLHECIEKCAALVSRFDTANFVIRVIKGGAHRDKFAEANDQLSQCSGDLKLLY
jgi:hypothetical protein